jgi:hypothetical protein
MLRLAPTPTKSAVLTAASRYSSLENSST